MSLPKPINPRSNQIRIIGGHWKRSLLSVVDVPGLRPTPDRVRETLCNWLAHQCAQDWASLRVLDLFAGTGALGLELASRGASLLQLNEIHPQVARNLRANINKVQASPGPVAQAIQLSQQDALITLRQVTQPFNLLLLDPPFGQTWLPKLWPLLPRALAAQAWVYVECEAPLATLLSSESFANFAVLRADKAGQVHYHLLHYSIA